METQLELSSKDVKKLYEDQKKKIGVKERETRILVQDMQRLHYETIDMRRKILNLVEKLQGHSSPIHFYDTFTI